MSAITLLWEQSSCNQFNEPQIFLTSSLLKVTRIFRFDSVELFDASLGFGGLMTSLYSTSLSMLSASTLTEGSFLASTTFGSTTRLLLLLLATGLSRLARMIGSTFGAIFTLARRNTSRVSTSASKRFMTSFFGISTTFTLSTKMMKSPGSKWHWSAGEPRATLVITHGLVQAICASNPNDSLEKVCKN